MRLERYLLIGFMVSAQAVAQGPCESLLGLSDDPILRTIQRSLGLTENTSAFLRCGRESERVTHYREQDLTYFSQDPTSDRDYRAELYSSTAGTILDFQPQNLLKGREFKEEIDPRPHIDMLKKEGFGSIGVLAD